MPNILLLIIIVCLRVIYADTSPELILFQTLDKQYEYSHYVLEQRSVFFWTPHTNGVLDIALAARTHGWIGIGFNPMGEQMVGSIACIGFYSKTDVEVYFLYSQSLTDIENNKLPSTSIVKNTIQFKVVNDYMLIQFTWNTSIPNSVYNFTLHQDTAIIFAYSVLPTLTPIAHAENSSSATIKLIDGTGRDPFYPCDEHCSSNGICSPIACSCYKKWHGVYCDLKNEWDITGVALVHGVMMYIAFGMMFPFGIAWARYAKKDGRHRYVFHQTIQGTTSMFLLSSIVLAVILVWSSEDIAALIKDTAHPVLGWCIVGLGCFQLLRSFYFSKTEKKTLLKKLFTLFHVWIGRVMIIAGWINAYLGILAVGVDIIFVHLHTAIICFWVIIFLVLEFRVRCCKNYSTVP